MEKRFGRRVVWVLGSALVVAALAPSAALAAGGKTSTTSSGSCSRRNPCTTDTSAPTIAISAPGAGSTVSGTVSVAGSAADNVGVTSVAVSVDGASASQASGTSSWTYSLNTSSLTNGSHSISARASDAAGNSSSTSVTVTVSNATSGGSTSASAADFKLSDPSASGNLAPLGRAHQAEAGDLTAVLYWDTSTARFSAFFRSASTGNGTYVALPLDSTNGWGNASYVLAGTSNLWVMGGSGPMYLRHYTLSGSPLPTSATLVSTQVLGDTDSQAGDLAVLASGGLVAAWHQQGATGPQGLYVNYRSPSGTWQSLPVMQFAPTNASHQVIVQHPVDKSVWIFSDPDAWSAIAAAHLTEGPSGLTVDWTNGSYITTATYGGNGPDPENPDLAASVDTSTGTIALAYQSSTRKVFSTNPSVIGSYVAIAHIPASGSLTFTQLPIYVERVSSLGLVVSGGQTWLAYRPIDASTLTFDHVYVSRFSGGAWASPVLLGQLYTPSQRIGYGQSRAEFSVRMADAGTHLLTAS